MTTSSQSRSDFESALAFHRAGDFESAARDYRKILDANPRLAPVHHNLGLVMQSVGDIAAAEKHFREALAIKPEHALAWNSLGTLLKDQQLFSDAVAAFETAIRFHPDYTEALFNLANVLHETDRSALAQPLFERIIALHPDHVEAHWSLGRLLSDTNRLEESLVVLEKAARLAGDLVEVRAALLGERCHACDWTDFEDDVNFILAAVKDGRHGVAPFLTLMIPAGASDQLQCANMFAGAMSAAALPGTISATADRIRLAYLSCDFRDHAVSRLMAELIERHDRSAFEVRAYSYGYDDGTPMRARLERSFDRFIDVMGRTDADIAAQIHADGIDILVDLVGYTGFARPEILARRPAPIQVNYLGYPGTMGAGIVDYIVADPFLIPPGYERFYGEQVVRLPHSYQPNDSSRVVDAHVPSRAACGLPPHGFVFCSFNASYKIVAAWFDVWMNLLRQIPGSVLWLIEGNDLAMSNLRRGARARGIAPDRLVFAPRRALPQHLARHAHADLFLDTLPYNAHTTMSDALWAGLPAISCASDTFAGRVGGSLLHAVGLGELVVSSREDYEALALALARDPARLTALRARLQARGQTSALFDSAAYTRDIEAAFTRMWQLHRAGKPPEAISV